MFRAFLIFILSFSVLSCATTEERRKGDVKQAFVYRLETGTVFNYVYRYRMVMSLSRSNGEVAKGHNKVSRLGSMLLRFTVLPQENGELPIEVSFLELDRYMEDEELRMDFFRGKIGDALTVNMKMDSLGRILDFNLEEMIRKAVEKETGIQISQMKEDERASIARMITERFSEKGMRGYFGRFIPIYPEFMVGELDRWKRSVELEDFLGFSDFKFDEQFKYVGIHEGFFRLDSTSSYKVSLSENRLKLSGEGNSSYLIHRNSSMIKEMSRMVELSGVTDNLNVTVTLFEGIDQLTE